MKILFVGDLNKNGRAFQRFEAMCGLGYAVTGISTFEESSDESGSFWCRLFSKLKFPLDETGANAAIKNALKRKFDLVWIDKGNTIYPWTLVFIKRRFPNMQLVSCSEDDMYAWHNRSVYYTLGLKYYDVVFTTKTYNIEELKRLGAQRVELFLDAFDENLHKPLELSEEEKNFFGAGVGFVGTFEQDRAKHMLFLAQNGIKVTVWGNGWRGWKNKHANLVIKDKAIYGEDYVRVINATKINLGFLRKMNRDQVTSRSVEIPACGGFLLAERTQRHLEFFEEGREAVFFGNKEELLSLCQYYLANPKERKQIAEIGRRRCFKSGYGQKEQVATILKKLTF